MAKKCKPKPPAAEKRTWDQLTDPEVDVLGNDEADDGHPVEFLRTKKGASSGKKRPGKK